MEGEKHDLIHEFPEHKQRIHELKMSDAHFAKLFEAYHEVEHEVHRIEQQGIDTSDQFFEEQKKKRLLLKDQLYQIIINK